MTSEELHAILVENMEKHGYTKVTATRIATAICQSTDTATLSDNLAVEINELAIAIAQSVNQIIMFQ